MKANTISYDPQIDTYYLIDKETGATIKAHKNGQLLKSFKKQITGLDYQKRKQCEPMPLYKMKPIQNKSQKLHKKQLLDQRFVNYNWQAQSIGLSRSKVSSVQITSRNSKRAQYDENGKNIKNRFSTDQNLLKLAETLGVRSSQLRQSQIDSLSSILKKYSTNRQQIIYDNHSLRKVQGSNQIKKINGFFETKTDLQALPSVYAKLTKKKKGYANLYDVCCLPNSKNTVSKEKQIFLRYNPQYKDRQNMRALNEMKDRKINFKKLEQLYIAQNNELTSSPYNSIRKQFDG